MKEWSHWKLAWTPSNYWEWVKLIRHPKCDCMPQVDQVSVPYLTVRESQVWQFKLGMCTPSTSFIRTTQVHGNNSYYLADTDFLW